MPYCGMLPWEVNHVYVVNIDKIPKEKLYICNEKIANYLQKDCGVPLFGNTEDGGYVFSRTDELYLALEKMPFWLRFFENVFLKGGNSNDK